MDQQIQYLTASWVYICLSEQSALSLSLFLIKLLDRLGKRERVVHALVPDKIGEVVSVFSVTSGNPLGQSTACLALCWS